MLKTAIVRRCNANKKLRTEALPAPRLILTQGCVIALRSCLEPEIRKGHEGISYLAGRSDGTTSLAVACMRPEAITTPGSFNVTAPSMARIVRTAVCQGLQVVGQVHTHPRLAYHSDGDEEGARIAYTGYVSIVLPDYGRRLPNLDKAAIFMFRAGHGFIGLDASNLTIIQERLA
jgi:proteasome lid subunit RPN8/RPN11